jgi:hypothetical protein
VLLLCCCAAYNGMLWSSCCSWSSCCAAAVLLRCLYWHAVVELLCLSCGRAAVPELLCLKTVLAGTCEPGVRRQVALQDANTRRLMGKYAVRSQMLPTPRACSGRPRADAARGRPGEGE